MPAGFNWELHLTQSEWRSYGSRATKGRNDVGGEMTNWGDHGVDQIQWALGKDHTLPVRFKPITSGQNGKVTAWNEDSTEIRFELDKGPMGGAIFVGERGKLEINRNKFMSNPIDIRDELLEKVGEATEEVKWSDQTALWQAKWHIQNWIDCIKSRERPVSDVEIGHRSIAVCHLANITRWIDRCPATMAVCHCTARIIRQRYVHGPKNTSKRNRRANEQLENWESDHRVRLKLSRYSREAAPSRLDSVQIVR